MAITKNMIDNSHNGWIFQLLKKNMVAEDHLVVGPERNRWKNKGFHRPCSSVLRHSSWIQGAVSHPQCSYLRLLPHAIMRLDLAGRDLRTTSWRSSERGYSFGPQVPILFLDLTWAQNQISLGPETLMSSQGSQWPCVLKLSLRVDRGGHKAGVGALDPKPDSQGSLTKDRTLKAPREKFTRLRPLILRSACLHPPLTAHTLPPSPARIKLVFMGLNGGKTGGAFHYLEVFMVWGQME